MVVTKRRPTAAVVSIQLSGRSAKKIFYFCFFLVLLGFGKQRPHHPGMGARLGVLPDVGLLGGVVFKRLQRQARVRVQGQRCQSLGSLDR